MLWVVEKTKARPEIDQRVAKMGCGLLWVVEKTKDRPRIDQS